MLRRTFMLFSAVMLVAAFALASVGVQPPDLVTVLGWVDASWPDRLAGLASSWVTDRLIQPLLDRPAWLLPGSLGLIFGAAAVTFPVSPKDSRKRVS